MDTLFKTELNSCGLPVNEWGREWGTWENICSSDHAEPKIIKGGYIPYTVTSGTEILDSVAVDGEDLQTGIYVDRALIRSTIEEIFSDILKEKENTPVIIQKYKMKHK